MAHGRCEAKVHDPRCRFIGEHAHHIHYRSQIPKACYWILENGAWLSGVCHTLAHETHNGNLSREKRRLASVTMRAEIARLFPDKPELLVPEEAA